MLTEPVDWRHYAGVGAIAFLAHTGLGMAGFTATALHLGIDGFLLLALGALCVWSFRACGALHCGITGPYYALLGLVGLSASAGFVDVSRSALWILFGVGVVVGVVMEWYVARDPSEPVA